MEKYNTLDYYNQNAKSYFEATKNGKMKEAYDHFLAFLKEGAYILDFGCGSGRDSRYFLKHGYKVRAIDGSEEMCRIASEYIGQEVEHMYFEDLTDENEYDGIWACSSILHVERKNLPDILKRMIVALKEDGTIYTSFKTGDAEVVQEGKYYNYMTYELLKDMLAYVDPNYAIVDTFGNDTDANVDRPKANWGNYLIRKRKIHNLHR